MSFCFNSKAVVLLAYGGPQNLQEIPSFLESILQNQLVPQQLLDEYVKRYQMIGGASPLNRLTLDQANALQDRLRQKGFDIRVEVGFRHSSPSIDETLKKLLEQKVEEIRFVIMNSFQSDASHQRYVDQVNRIMDKLNSHHVTIHFMPSFHTSRGFIEAYVRETEIAISKIPPHLLASTTIVFTAHSIPIGMAKQSPYASQLEKSARLVTKILGYSYYRIGYQSISGQSKERWLGPDIKQIIDEEGVKAKTNILVVPIGFICDHLEVLYDIDIDAKHYAEKKGLSLHRAQAIGCAPSFIESLAQIVTSE